MEIILLKIFCVSFYSSLDVQSEHVNIEEDLTLVIDFEKYQQLVNARRHPRNARSLNQTKSSNCMDLEKEEYQKCGNNCVLGCRFDSIILSENATSTENKTEKCDATKCIEGCFCKKGLVRHHRKCIPATECPARKSRIMGMLYENPSYQSKILGLFQRPSGTCTAMNPSACKPQVIQVQTQSMTSIDRVFFFSQIIHQSRPIFKRWLKQK